MNFIFPVAQKVQFNAHPACEDIHNVFLFRFSSSVYSEGMRTDSIDEPSLSSKRNFIVPSEECCDFVILNEKRLKSSDNFIRNDLGMFEISSNESTLSANIFLKICLALNFWL